MLAVMVPGPAPTEDWAAETPAGFTVTAAVWLITVEPFTVAEIVFPSAVVDRKVPVVTPREFVFPGCTKVLFDPVEESATPAP